MEGLAGKIFLDTDVILDFLTDRLPFSEDASQIFDLANNGQIIASTSVLCLHNVHYFVRKMVGSNKAKTILKDLLSILEIEGTEKDDIIAALGSDFNDFEDAVQNATAERTKAWIIVTRNLKDFKKSNLLVLTPREYLKSIVN